jgi:hypothetical protein
MLKKAHLLRYPARSPTRGRGKSRSLFVATPPLILSFGGLLHLPACRSLGAGRGIFEHPGKNDFFSSPLGFVAEMKDEKEEHGHRQRTHDKSKKKVVLSLHALSFECPPRNKCHHPSVPVTFRAGSWIRSTGNALSTA